MSTQTTRKTYARAMLDIRDAYRNAGQLWPAQSRDIACWAIDEGHWEPPPELALNKCTRDLSDAFKNEHHTDAQGRRGVRSNVAARLEYVDEHGETKQGTFWDGLYTASEDHLLTSLDQQRNQVVCDAKSIQLQVDSANDNNPNLTGRPIKPVWNLTEEVAEAVEANSSADPKKPR